MKEKILIKIVALRKVASDVLQELEEAEKKASKPTSANRTEKKKKRIEGIAAFYLKRKIS